MKLTDGDRARIRYYRQEEELSYRAIARIIGCDHSTVRYVIEPDKYDEHKQATEQWKKDNPEQYLRAIMIRMAERRASQSGVSFDESFMDSVGECPANCPACSVTMQRGEGRIQPNSPSIDRIVPELGYVPGNVQWLCQSCNAVKNDRGMEYLLERLGQ
jgi:hypothetical protein